MRRKAKKTRGIPSRSSDRSGTRDRAIPGPVPALLLGIGARPYRPSFSYPPRERALVRRFRVLRVTARNPRLPPPPSLLLPSPIDEYLIKPCQRAAHHLQDYAATAPVPCVTRLQFAKCHVSRANDRYSHVSTHASPLPPLSFRALRPIFEKRCVEIDLI